MISEEERKAIQEELKWIDLSEYSERQKKTGILTYLVPLGCLVTAGVLASGLGFMAKKKSGAQQKLMRYRILTQAVTIGLAMFGIMKVGD